MKHIYKNLYTKTGYFPYQDKGTRIKIKNESVVNVLCR